ncbi:MAG: YggT family protein [Chloroflexi bacterium]|nr:YggT family protein [Chloroflexota bacterium]
MEALGLFLQILVYVLIASIFIRIIFSWTGVDPSNPLYGVIHEITEPILGPIRSIMPRLGMIDLSPMIAMFLLFIMAQVAGSL